jgi:hypothetical protein
LEKPNAICSIVKNRFGKCVLFGKHIFSSETLPELGRSRGKKRKKSKTTTEEKEFHPDIM